MVQRYIPAAPGGDDDAGSYGVVADRLDRIEVTLNDLGDKQQGIRADIDQLGNIVANALEGGDGPKDGQRLWLEVDDPDLAETWLLDLIGWTQRVLAHLAQTEIPQCWPWHPYAVTELLALQAQYEWAYAQDTPTPVSEYLRVYLPSGVRRVRDALAQCQTANHGAYIDGSQLKAYLHWWTTTDRQGQPPGDPGIPS